MQGEARLLACVLLMAFSVCRSHAGFSSLWIFGDGVCTTTNNVSTDPEIYPYYYGYRFTNGRVWLEVLAQRLGITYNSSRNWSFFGNTSTNVLAELASFSAPGDVGTALFVVWANDADFVQFMNYGGPSAVTTALVNSWITNHSTIIQSLYNKGVRTLVMPNAVDVTLIPLYSDMSASDKAYIRSKVAQFNSGFVTALNQARTTYPALKIYMPDFCTLLNNIVANPSNYGLTNPPPPGDAYDDLWPNLLPLSTTGPGATYLFWDDSDPSAKAHMIMADLVQPLLSRPSVSKIVKVGTSNRLDVLNVPVGRDGAVDRTSSLNPVAWSQVKTFTSSSASLSVYVTNSGPRQFYRLRFPPATWTWP